MPRINYQQHEQEQFYQMPKWLFEGRFKKLSNNARVAYALLKSRHDLSVKNRWIDENGDIYLIFTIKELEELLNCSKPSVIKYKKELIENDLIEEVRQGLKQPNLIYLQQPTLEPQGSKESLPHEVNKINFKKSKSFTSRSKESLHKITDFSNTDFSYNDSIYLSVNNDDVNDLFVNYRSLGITKELFIDKLNETNRGIELGHVVRPMQYLEGILKQIVKYMNPIEEKEVKGIPSYNWLEK